MLISVKLLTKYVIRIYTLGSVLEKFGVWIKAVPKSLQRQNSRPGQAKRTAEPFQTVSDAGWNSGYNVTLFVEISLIVRTTGYLDWGEIILVSQPQHRLQYSTAGWYVFPSFGYFQYTVQTFTTGDLGDGGKWPFWGGKGVIWHFF